MIALILRHSYYYVKDDVHFSDFRVKTERKNNDTGIWHNSLVKCNTSPRVWSAFL